eukprot:793205-Alexandrium_andersonii.AAC.1
MEGSRTRRGSTTGACEARGRRAALPNWSSEPVGLRGRGDRARGIGSELGARGPLGAGRWGLSPARELRGGPESC